LFHLTLASNAIHLEAARRLRQTRDQLRPAALELLIWEPRRCVLSTEDRRRWPLRLPVGSLSLALLVPLAMAGLVRELRLAHLRDAGRALRWIVHHARHLVLLDDGLDQYRQRPRALEPCDFPVGTTCWLFSDAPAFRADWCHRFDCHELGPLYTPALAEVNRQSQELGQQACGTLIIDSPGIERFQLRVAELPRPWCLLPHPVERKRSWQLSPQAADRILRMPPELLLPGWHGTVLVGESLMLLAALRLCPVQSRLLVSLPSDVDHQLRALALAGAAGSPPGHVDVV